MHGAPEHLALWKKHLTLWITQRARCSEAPREVLKPVCEVLGSTVRGAKPSVRGVEVTSDAVKVSTLGSG